MKNKTAHIIYKTAQNVKRKFFKLHIVLFPTEIDVKQICFTWLSDFKEKRRPHFTEARRKISEIVFADARSNTSGLSIERIPRAESMLPLLFVDVGTRKKFQVQK